MFRTALRASNFSKYALLNASRDPYWTTYYEAYPVNVPANDTGIPAPQTIQLQQTSIILIFQSHYSYLAAALALMVTGTLVVIPTFHGFRELGRETSLNPLEIARAINADMLSGQGSNASVVQLMKDIGTVW
jgi:hypothetical protein